MLGLWIISLDNWKAKIATFIYQFSVWKLNLQNLQRLLKQTFLAVI